MATPTVLFPWETGLVLTAGLILISDDTIIFSSASCTEKPNAKGIYAATFTSPTAGDYFIVPYLSGVALDGVGTVFSLTDTSAVFRETELLAPGSVTMSQGNIDDISDGVVAAIQAIPGFSVQIISPTAEDGTIRIRQGDAYLAANSPANPIQLSITGSLPTLEAACTLRIFTGMASVSITGTVTVVSATNYTLKFDITGTVSAALPAGLFDYEVEVTYFGTTNKWTPSSGQITVLPQIG